MYFGEVSYLIGVEVRTFNHDANFKLACEIRDVLEEIGDVTEVRVSERLTASIQCMVVPALIDDRLSYAEEELYEKVIEKLKYINVVDKEINFLKCPDYSKYRVYKEKEEDYITVERE
ncbi:hypothetical protein CIW83_18170 [Tissierella sp. P1]|uniref:hypothetical protein n=1 Tax=Tissierella sp. P1 TaxID=1280483 RepID=UPI000BA0E80D|nr:hypothetical protein [Tissierella sp. P1]OZV10850.1 hypothetical protein CIW83_18170 [Tissierella sp. P1]